MFARIAFASVLAAALTACDRDPPDLREWRVSDHDHTSNPNSDQVQVDPADAGAGGVLGIDEVVVVAWRQNCVTCHGTIGRGDGPQGRMLRATDLTDPDWQNGISDETIARAIRSGKGSMPAFNLPDGTVTGLVRLIRLLNAARFAAAAAAAGSATPAASAPPTAGSAPAASGAPGPVSGAHAPRPTSNGPGAGAAARAPAPEGAPATAPPAGGGPATRAPTSLPAR